MLGNLHKLYHVIDSVARYLESMRKSTDGARKKVGETVIAATRRATTGSYERACLLSLFTQGQEFDNEERFEKLYNDFPDPSTRREVILALGRAHKQYWFSARKRQLGELDPWTRRAFIAAASCLSSDERGPFYRSLREGTDILEGAVIKWAADNPF